MSQDVVADGLNQIMNTKKAGKQEIILKRYSKLLINVLEIGKKHKYIEDYQVDEKEKKLKIKIGKINKCQAIKPRYFVGFSEIDRYVRRFLLARNFGIIIISTSQGLLTHEEAEMKEIGGSLVAYMY